MTDQGEQVPPAGAVIKLTCPACGQVQYWTEAEVAKMTEIVHTLQRGKLDMQGLLPRHAPCNVLLVADLLSPYRERYYGRQPQE